MGRNHVSLADEADQELLTMPGWSAVAGSPSGSVIHSAAASSALPAPTPFAPIAFATISRDSGATPIGPPPALPPAIVPAVWVPWPLSSTGVGLEPTKSRQATTLPASSGLEALTPVSMVPTRTPAPRTPKVDHAAGAWMAGTPQSPEPASGKGAASMWPPSVRTTAASRLTDSTAGSAATVRTSSGVPLNATALISQKGCTGPSMSSVTASWVAPAVRWSARSSACGRPA